MKFSNEIYVLIECLITRIYSNFDLQCQWTAVLTWIHQGNGLRERQEEMNGQNGKVFKVVLANFGI